MRRIRDRVPSLVDDDRGSAPVEFVLVGTLLTLVTLAALQFGLAVYVRNVVHDAAVEGAYHAALADTSPADGAERTRAIVSRTVGAQYAADVVVDETADVATVTVRTAVPLFGLWGIPGILEVTAHAPVESFR
ncbi:TadE/TadG family type IV pilus assembly protein [Planococcus sp. APC 4015]|nr:TadE/TadG family type IV pilus assembly protein [Planococcus sp. APC 4015]